MTTPVKAAIITALALSIPGAFLTGYELGRASSPERIVIEALDQPMRVER